MPFAWHFGGWKERPIYVNMSPIKGLQVLHVIRKKYPEDWKLKNTATRPFDRSPSRPVRGRLFQTLLELKYGRNSSHSDVIVCVGNREDMKWICSAWTLRPVGFRYSIRQPYPVHPIFCDNEDDIAAITAVFCPRGTLRMRQWDGGRSHYSPSQWDTMSSSFPRMFVISRSAVWMYQWAKHRRTFFFNSYGV